MNKAVIGIVLVALAVGFAGGMFYKDSTSSDVAGVPGGAQAGPGGGMGADGPTGGPLANLSDEERAELEAMTPEERQAFMQEKFGDDMPARGGAGGPGGIGRGGLIEGEIVEATDDTLTIALAAGGSNAIGLDDETVIASVAGVQSALAEGASVLVFSETEAEGVVTARAIIVR